ncbi:MAG: TonB-dependent receptor [Myxococcota bacterium]
MRPPVALVVLLFLALASSGVVRAQVATGTFSGRVFDGEDRRPIEGATVIVEFPEPEDGSPPLELVTRSGPAGDFEFEEDIPAGFYVISLVKAGYRASVISDFEVVAGEENFIEFPMPRQPSSAGGDVMELEAFAVSAEVVGDLMDGVELRLEGDEIVNLLSAEDLSKFAASDVADALKRVAGVNVVEGQFAIIRGLEDRYSSTTYNGAPIPSPDPDSQSVQLDLFPSDIVSNLNIGKAFTPRDPANSSGGSIDILTHDYPEELTAKVSLGTGFHERTLDEFLRLDRGSPIGIEQDGVDLIESDFSALLGGSTELFGREVRFKIVAAHEVDYATLVGHQQVSEPAEAQGPFRDGEFLRVFRSGGGALGTVDRRGPVFQLEQSRWQEQRTFYAGFGFDLDADGAHTIDGSVFHTRKQDETVQLRSNAFVEPSRVDVAPGAPGFDFYDNLNAGNAATPGFFSARRFANQWAFQWFNPDEQDGIEGGNHAFFSPIFQSNTFERERDLTVYQINARHELDDFVEGLTVTWIANYAETNQEETTFQARYSYNTVENLLLRSEGVNLPSALPARPSDFTGRGIYAARSDLVYGANEIEENQYFGRIDLEYVFSPVDWLEAAIRTGYWWEQGNRSVTSRFLFQAIGDPRQPGVHTPETIVDGLAPGAFDTSQPGSFYNGAAPLNQSFTVIGDTPVEMGRRLLDGAGISEALANNRPGTSDNKREVRSFNIEGKATLFERVDVLAGLRIEQLRIVSKNDPFSGFCGGVAWVDGACPDPENLGEQTTPPRFLFPDRRDNPAPPDVASPPEGFTFNDELIGFRDAVPDGELVDCFTRECLEEALRGEIDELYFLPSVGLAYRPWTGWVFRFAYSRTVARPSFRELGYYASVESNSDDFFVGNPSLGTSDVESFDGRVEWTFGDYGDLFAASVFYKTIADPIEQIIIVDQSGAECLGVCSYRTFLNNPAEAELLGMELEGRRTLDFIGHEALGGFMTNFSIGGNFTYIDASVARSEIQRERSITWFGATDADIAAGRRAFDRMSRKRRLFGQPEWIANADLTFDHPEWRTKATLSIFAISEVLDAIGSNELSIETGVIGTQFDRYLDQFYQLDLVVSQGFDIPGMPGEFTARASIRNLTDTTRKIIYDQDQTIDDIAERSFKLGRDYAFAIGYTFTY